MLTGLVVAVLVALAVVGAEPFPHVARSSRARLRAEVK